MKKTLRSFLTWGLILALIFVPVLNSQKILDVSQDVSTSVSVADAQNSTDNQVNIDDNTTDTADEIIKIDSDGSDSDTKTLVYTESEAEAGETAEYDNSAAETLVKVDESGETDVIKSEEQTLAETRQIVVSAENVAEDDRDHIVDIIGDYAILEFETEEAVKEAFEEYKQQEEGEVFAPSIMKAFDTGAADYSGISWGYDAVFSGEFNDALLKKYGSIENIPTVTVGVIDTGVDYTHSFLEGRVVAHKYDFVDKDGDSMDEFDHGTHVAGIITDNTLPNVKISAYRVLDSNGYGYNTDVALGIKQAADDGTDVINLSLGGSHSADGLLDAALEYAFEKGVIVVISAGNDHTDVKTACPAHYQKALTVAALDRWGDYAYYSNYGMGVDISAPGSYIYSSVLENEYEYFDGTSMAAPFVAAAAASLKAYLNDSNITNDAIAAILKSNATDMGTAGFDIHYGYGMLNMQNVLNSVSSDDWEWSGVTEAPVVNIPLEDGILTLEMTAEDGAVIYYTLDGTMPSTDGSNPATRIYTGPETFSESIKVYAIAKSPNKLMSEYVKKNGYIKPEDANYEISDDGVLLAYTGNESIVYIPEEICGITVKEIGESCFEHVAYVSALHIPDTVTKIHSYALTDSRVGSVYLGKSVQYIGSFSLCGNYINYITVDPENPYLICEDGALYSSDYEYLFSLGAYKDYYDYKVNPACKKIVRGAIIGSYISRIYIPDSVEDLNSKTNFNEERYRTNGAVFSYAEYIVDENNKNYSSENGALYNKDKTYLYGYSRKLNNESFVVPDTVTEIREFAFVYCKDLKEIKLSSNIEKIEYGTFSYSGITTYSIPEKVNSIGRNAFCNDKTIYLFFDGNCPEYLNSINNGMPVVIYKHAWATGFEEGARLLGKWGAVTCYNIEDFLDISVKIPEGFDTDRLYLDGVAYDTTFDTETGLYSIKAPTYHVSTLVAYKNNGDNNPRDLHIWYVSFSNSGFKADDAICEISESGVVNNYAGNDTILYIPSEIVGIKITGIGRDFLTDSVTEVVYIPETVVSMGYRCLGGKDRIKVLFEGNCPLTLEDINAGIPVDIYKYSWATGYEEGISLLRTYGEVYVYDRDSIAAICVDIPDKFETSYLSLNGVDYPTIYDSKTGLYCVYPNTPDVKCVNAFYFVNGKVYSIHSWDAEYVDGKYELTEIKFDIRYNGILENYSDYSGQNRILYLPDSVGGITVTELGYNLRLYAVDEVYVPDSVIKLEANSLNCYSLKSVHLGKNVREIGTSAFDPSDNIEEIIIDPENPYLVLHEGVLYSSDYEYLFTMAAHKQEGEYHIPEGCKKIVEGAFYSRGGLTIYVPKTVETLCSGANYKDWIRYSRYGYLNTAEYIIDEDNPYLTSENNIVYNKEKTVVYCGYKYSKYDPLVLPDTVVEIGVEAFAECDVKNAVVLPEGLKKIDRSAFEDVLIGDYVIPSTVEYLGFYCFSGLSSYHAGEFPLNLYFEGDCPETIYDVNEGYEVNVYKYSNAKGFDTGLDYLRKCSIVNVYDRDAETKVYVSIPEGYDTGKIYLNGTEYESFYDENTGLYYADSQTRDITLAEVRKYQKDGTVIKQFWNVQYKINFYETILIPYEVSSEGKIVKYLGSDETVSLPADIAGTSIVGVAKSAFKGSCVKEVIIPDSVISLDDYAFDNVPTLEKITLGKNVNEIGFWAMPWNQLELAVDGNSEYFTVIDNVLYNKAVTVLFGYGRHSGDSFNVPATVTQIEKLAFYGSTSLAAVTLPEGLTSIKQYAFAGTSISAYTMPSTVNEIESLALGDGSRTVTVWFDGNCPATLGNINAGGAVIIYKYPWATGYETGLDYLRSECEVTVIDREFSTAMKLSIPEGYDTSVLYIDGVEYATSFDEATGTFVVDTGSTAAKTISAFRLNAAGSPVGMYVWTINYENGIYAITPHPELADILNYKGFSIRISGYSGIRYKADILTETKQQLASESGYYGFKLKEYGVLAIPSAYLSRYPLVLGGARVNGTVDYSVNADGTVSEKLFESAGGFDSFTGLLINIPESGYKTEVAFRAYITLEKDGTTYTFYHKPVARSIYYLASQYIGRGMYEEGTVEYDYIMGIINVADNQ